MQKPLANCRLFYLLSQSTISEILDFGKRGEVRIMREKQGKVKSLCPRINTNDHEK